MTPKTPKKRPDDLFKDSTMSFGEHLDELRACLWKATAGIAVGFIIGLYFGPHVVNFIQTPVQNALKAYTQEKALADAKKLGLENVLPGATAMIEQGYYFEEWFVEPENYAQATGGPPSTSGDVQKRSVGSLNFTAADLKPLQLAKEWTRQLQVAESAPSAWWPLLSTQEQEFITSLAAQSHVSAEQTQQLLTLLNNLCQQANLAASLKGKSPVKLELDANTQALLARPELSPPLQTRLGRRLLHHAFPKLLPEPSLELVPFVLWRPNDKHPRVDSKVLTVLEPFSIWMTSSMVVGAIIAGPWVFYQIWMFVAAGLYPHERNYVYLYGPMSMLLFALGVALAFFFVFPPVLGFLFGVMSSLGIDIELRLSDWITFVLMLPIGFGISFQLPLVMLFLNRIGLFTLSQYISQWRIAVMVIFVLSAVLTPADPQSMLLMALPLCFLYMFGLLLCRFMPKSSVATVDDDAEDGPQALGAAALP